MFYVLVELVSDFIEQEREREGGEIFHSRSFGEYRVFMIPVGTFERKLHIRKRLYGVTFDARERGKDNNHSARQTNFSFDCQSESTRLAFMSRMAGEG